MKRAALAVMALALAGCTTQTILPGFLDQPLGPGHRLITYPADLRAEVWIRNARDDEVRGYYDNLRISGWKELETRSPQAARVFIRGNGASARCVLIEESIIVTADGESRDIRNPDIDVPSVIHFARTPCPGDDAK